MQSYHIPLQQIESELKDIETNVAQLERDGVELEKKLRSCEEGMISILHVKIKSGGYIATL